METVVLKITAWLGGLLIQTIAWFSTLFPSIIGSALSMFLAPEKIKQLSKLSKMITFFFGVVLGHQVGGAVIQHWQIIPLSPIASTIQIIVGFMGMAALAEAKIQLPIAITAMRRKWFGE